MFNHNGASLLARSCSACNLVPQARPSLFLSVLNNEVLYAPVGLVIVCHVTDTPLGEPQRVEMIRYLRNVQREDGGWGL